MKSIVFLDLDGTFWIYGNVPPSAQEAVRRAQENGHLVLSNSGRSRGGCRDMSPYGLDGTCFAAGADVELHGEKIFDRPLALEDAHRLFDAIHALGLNFNAECGRCNFLCVQDQPLMDRMKAELDRIGQNENFLNSPSVEDMTEADFRDVYKFSIFTSGPDAAREAVASCQVPGYHWTQMGHAAEITQESITKAGALETVRSAVQARTGEAWRTVALGDSSNDLPMLRAADFSVAMGNGTEEAKAASTWVTKRIDENGLYRAFEHLGLI